MGVVAAAGCDCIGTVRQSGRCSCIAACVPRQRLQRLCSTHLRQKAGRSAASWRGAFDLPALPGGREEVLWSGSTGMDAGHIHQIAPVTQQLAKTVRQTLGTWCIRHNALPGKLVISRKRPYGLSPACIAGEDCDRSLRSSSATTGIGGYSANGLTAVLYC